MKTFDYILVTCFSVFLVVVVFSQLSTRIVSSINDSSHRIEAVTK